MMTSEEVFELVRETPAMYIGSRSVDKLFAFMSGYRHALSASGEDLWDDTYRRFQRWVEQRFNIRTSQSWARIISFMSTGEAEAFELTKELWFEYKSQLPLDESRSVRQS